jgi:hypothetical protein
MRADELVEYRFHPVRIDLQFCRHERGNTSGPTLKPVPELRRQSEYRISGTPSVGYPRASERRR